MIAHADTIASLGQFTLLTAASHLSVVPTADIWVTGIFGESLISIACSRRSASNPIS